MKKSIPLMIFLVVIGCVCNAQDLQLQRIDSLKRLMTDSLHHELSITTQDTSRVLVMASLCDFYMFNKPDSSLFYGLKAIALARKIGFPKGEVTAMQSCDVAMFVLGNFSRSFQIVLQGIKIADKNHLPDYKALLLIGEGSTYLQVGDYKKAVVIYKEALALLDSIRDVPGYSTMAQSFITVTQSWIVEPYIMLGQNDSALYYGKLAFTNAQRINENWVSVVSLNFLGKIQEKVGHTNLALNYFHQSVELGFDAYWFFRSNFSIAQLYQHQGMVDSSIHYGEKSLAIARASGIFSQIIDAGIFLSEVYDKKDPGKALEYNKIALAYKDSLSAMANKAAMESIASFDEQERQYEIDTATTAYQNRLRQYALLAGLGVFLLIAFILYRNNRNKQKANKTLAQQKQKVETTLTELKSTQSQLIQSEKMASLGELTAGIAHEIQNPLNFVNNFSEVSNELLDEMKDEFKKGDIEEGFAIADDIKQNLEKINHHGKRADAIVKSMLEHSKASTGIKEPTDINKLADEYLRLAYHGLQAKDKFFNTEIKTDFDESIGEINIIPQDIGRVLLNLYNNAFYAVNEHASAGSAGQNYQPTVSVSTKKEGDRVTITVKDNGGGIPEKIKEKIFQPFFTTKPTGQGTGLGLSLSYDIVKAHGGEIKVESKEGEGTQFIIMLNQNLP